MDKFPKPSCYDSVPPCLCQKCQRYDKYMASCVPRTLGQTTCGLAVVNAARSSFSDVYSRSVRRKPARSCSRPAASPVTSSPVAVRSSTVSALPRPVAASTVVSRPAPFGSRTRSSPVPAVVSSPARSFSSSPVVSSPSSVSTPSSAIVSCPASSGSLACPVPVSPVYPSPVVVPSSKARGVSSGPAGSGSTVSSSTRPVPVCSVPRFVRPRAPLSVGPSVVSPFACSVSSPFVPVVCFVLVVVPVLLLSPFGLVRLLLPVWRWI